MSRQGSLPAATAVPDADSSTDPAAPMVMFPALPFAAVDVFTPVVVLVLMVRSSAKAGPTKATLMAVLKSTLRFTIWPPGVMECCFIGADETSGPGVIRAKAQTCRT